MKDYQDDRLSPGFTMLLWRLGSGCCLSLCWEPGFLPWSPFFHAHRSTCSDLWPQTCSGTHPWSGPELGVWKVLSHPQSQELWISLVAYGSPLSWDQLAFHNYCLTLLPPTSVLCCALKFPYVRLLIWTSFSVLKLGALEIMSYTPSPVPGQQGSYIPNPWLVIVRETWSPKVCLFLPELSNNVKWEKSGVVCWDISHKVTCTHSYLGGGGKSTGQGVVWLHGNPSLKGWMFGLILDRQCREQVHSS